MTANAGDIASYPLKSAKRDRIEMEMRGAITGVAGAIALPLTNADDPAMSITRGVSAGLYNLTFPASADGFGMLEALVVSPAGTVKNWYAVALNFAAGTAQVQTTNAAGASTDPAAGDSLLFSIKVNTRKDF